MSLDFGEQRRLGTDIVVVLRKHFVGTQHSLLESVKYLVRVQVGLRVVCDTIMVLELLKQGHVGVQRSVRNNCDILQSHGIWGALSDSSVLDRSCL